MNLSITIKIGETPITVSGDFAGSAEFFRKVAFYQEIPSVGPNGETDLKITYRTTKQGHKYYSVVSKEAGMEFCYGQYLDNAEALFPKKWEKLWVPDPSQGSGSTAAAAPTPAPTPASTQVATETGSVASASPSKESKAIVDKYV